jgi:hypothetical protein
LNAMDVFLWTFFTEFGSSALMRSHSTVPSCVEVAGRCLQNVNERPGRHVTLQKDWVITSYLLRFARTFSTRFLFAGSYTDFM